MFIISPEFIINFKTGVLKPANDSIISEHPGQIFSL